MMKIDKTKILATEYQSWIEQLDNHENRTNINTITRQPTNRR